MTEKPKRRAWVLDTATKGTGATMVPLDKVERKPEPSGEPLFVPPTRRPPAPKPPTPRAPRRFRVVDVMSGEVLADDVDARTTLRVLSEQRSTVDVRVYIWEPDTEKWRLLSLAEQRLLWERRTA